jgi:integrase
LFTRTRYQYGSLRLKKRQSGADAWEFRYYVNGAAGERKRQHVTIGTKETYPTDTLARIAVQSLLLKLNSEAPRAELETPNFGALIDKFVEEEMSERYSTRKSYESMLKNHIRPKWGDYPLDRFKPMPVEQWLRQLELAPKSKAHVRSLMHLIFTCAERWCLIEMGKNPMALVRVKDCTKRLKRPRVLTEEQFYALLPHLKEPYRTMVIVAQCLGLRVSEIMALQWGDFDFEERTLLVQRSVVHGRVDGVKTEYSRDHVPLDRRLAGLLLEWQAKGASTSPEDWVFANPATGKPYHQEEIQKTHIKRAAIAAEIGGDIGWHTFRHTYRSWLDETGAPMKVQQELMRHASIQTTMNVYGQAMSSSKRDANSKVVQMVLGTGSAASA